MTEDSFKQRAYDKKKHMSCSQREHFSKKNEAELVVPYSYYVSQNPTLTKIPNSRANSIQRVILPLPKGTDMWLQHIFFSTLKVSDKGQRKYESY